MDSNIDLGISVSNFIGRLNQKALANEALGNVNRVRQLKELKKAIEAEAFGLNNTITLKTLNRRTN